MAQDTRKDPRAKVLTMTLRYQSATLDEFIEHHSYDVSRGGMFIKTQSPFPPGTLLKLEVKVADVQKLMQGVGRVVWKRESSDASPEKPAGMGVKFIKVDDESKRIIGQLVASRGDDSQSAFDAGRASAAPPRAASSAPAKPAQSSAPAGKSATSTKPAPAAVPRATTSAPPEKRADNVRKATMIGLGAISKEPPRPTASAPPEQPKDEQATGGTFFPETDSKQDMPPPEDRTVMRQAEELLEDALREAGGSMEEIGEQAPAPRSATSDKPSGESAQERKPEAKAAAAAVSAPARHQDRDDVEDEEEKPEVEPKAAKAEPPPKVRERMPASKPSTSSRAPTSQRPRATRSSALEQAAEEGGGGGKTVWLILAALLVGGGVYAFTKSQREQTAQEPP